MLTLKRKDTRKLNIGFHMKQVSLTFGFWSLGCRQKKGRKLIKYYIILFDVSFLSLLLLFVTNLTMLCSTVALEFQNWFPAAA